MRPHPESEDRRHPERVAEQWPTPWRAMRNPDANKVPASKPPTDSAADRLTKARQSHSYNLSHVGSNSLYTKLSGDELVLARKAFDAEQHPPTAPSYYPRQSVCAHCGRRFDVGHEPWCPRKDVTS